MNKVTETYGYAEFKRRGQELGRTMKRKTVIESMTLSQALEAKNKYLTWAATCPNHPELPIKTHIYETYLLPRIEELQLEHDTIKTLIAPTPTLEELQKEELGF